MTIRIALIGFGKIASEQHLPAIADDPRFTLVAVCTPGRDPAIGVPCFRSSGAMFAALAGQLDAVAVCTPPSVRFAIACEAIEAGCDVLLEKPPATTLGELDALIGLAQNHRRGVYAGWHSQHAPGVGLAAATLAGQDVEMLDICWHEDVRKWHPGQDWIWKAGGFGVFDPGINALAIASHILDEPLLVSDATLLVPANRQVPIAASIRFAGEAMTALMDWRPTSEEKWTVRARTSRGQTVELLYGGSKLRIDGVDQELTGPSSYPAMYNRFAEICAGKLVEIDREPLRLVADIFLAGSFNSVESFD